MKKILFTIGLLLALTSFHNNGFAVIEAVEFDTIEDEKRYKSLIDELRCLVCQNQNLSGSNAPLAKDLRDITANMIKDGASDSDIKEFMRSRYGDFVLYEPPFNYSTAFLWLGPFALLILVVIGLGLNIKRRQQDELFQSAHAKNDAEQIKVRNLLRDTPSLNTKNENSAQDKPQ